MADPKKQNNFLPISLGVLFVILAHSFGFTLLEYTLVILLAFLVIVLLTIFLLKRPRLSLPNLRVVIGYVIFCALAAAASWTDWQREQHSDSETTWTWITYGLLALLATYVLVVWLADKGAKLISWMRSTDSQ